MHKIHQLVAATATAMVALSIGTRERMGNEHHHFKKDVKILEVIQNEDEGGYELVAVTEK